MITNRIIDDCICDPQPTRSGDHQRRITMSGKYAFSKALKELRFHHCQTSEHSNAVRYVYQTTLHKIMKTPLTHSRSFLSRAYPSMKKSNPYTPILVREASGIEPRVYARYEFGREKVADLKGKIQSGKHRR